MSDRRISRTLLALNLSILIALIALGAHTPGIRDSVERVFLTSAAALDPGKRAIRKAADVALWIESAGVPDSAILIADFADPRTSMIYKRLHGTAISIGLLVVPSPSWDFAQLGAERAGCAKRLTDVEVDRLLNGNWLLATSGIDLAQKLGWASLDELVECSQTIMASGWLDSQYAAAAALGYPLTGKVFWVRKGKI